MAEGLPRPQVQESISSDDGRARRQFAERIHQFSSRKKESYVFSGEHFRFLSEFLKATSRTWTAYGGAALRSTPPFIPVHLVVNKGNGNSNQREARGLSLSASTSSFSVITVDESDNLESLLTQHSPAPQTSLLVFLSGWQSADWLRVFGAQCGVEPELLRRHLAFLETRAFFDQPSLPSSHLAVWRVQTVTIYVRKTPLSLDEVRRRRRTDDADVRNYLHRLRSVQPMGTSILRRHVIIDETTSAIMQDVSFCVHVKRAGGWIGTLWLDSGRPFDPGAAKWFVAADDDREDPYIPLVLHRPKIAISPPETSKTAALPTATSTTARSAALPCPSFSYLPSRYGSSLDPNLARVDALYAFSELLALAASSENQFLNLIHAQIDIALGYHGVEALSIENLQYLVSLLKDLIERTEEAIYLLENETHSKWPMARDPAGMQTRETTRKLLLDDYCWILRRGKAAKERIQDGITAITTDVTARDAQRSIDQAREIGRMTVLAYFFLPLSFTTSIFSMNFVNLENTRWGVCSVIIAFFVIMTPSLVLCFWDRMF